MKLFRNIFLFLTLAAMISCGGESISDKLAQADALVKEKPDSAYNILNEILFPEELPEAQWAEYARLYAKAASKSSHSFLGDTMLVAAGEYYLSQNDSLAVHECYMLEGERQIELHNVADIVKYMELAASLLPDSLSSRRDAINKQIFQALILPKACWRVCQNTSDII